MVQIRSFSAHQNFLETENFEKSYGCSKLVEKSKIQGNRGIHNPFTKESNQKLSQIRKTIENPLKIKTLWEFFSYSRFVSSELIFCVVLIKIISYRPKSRFFMFLCFSIFLACF